VTALDARLPVPGRADHALGKCVWIAIWWSPLVEALDR
jgi:hypothetical protein